MSVEILLLAALTLLGDDGFGVGPLPGWVDPLPVPQLPTRVDPPWRADDFRSLLVDEQTDLRGSTPEHFVHTAVRLVDALDVREQSHVEILFDPEYEQVVLHFVRLHRDGRVRELLDPARVSVIQREPELDLLLYDGQRTLLFFPEGVARGDVLEVAYTVRGANPVFDGHPLAELGLASGAGDVRLRQRVLSPSTDTLRFAVHGTSLQERVERCDDAVVHTWERALVPPLPYEDGAPAWADDLAWIQASDFANWAEVVAWGLELYDADVSSPELVELARHWARLAPDDEGRILLALRFVQDEVRYLGFELGPGSHRPRAPGEVLAKRFGDCKDKSLLLVSLLRQLGVDAAPALVSTVLGSRLDALLPSPWVFDHVVVRVRDGERVTWLDPTQLSERGSLDERRHAPFGRALVLEASEEVLAVVPADPGATPDEITTLDLGRLDPDRPTTLRWRAEYRREAANTMRRDLDWDGLDVLAGDVQLELASFDPALRASGVPSLLDDESANRLQLAATFSARPLLVRDDDRLVLRVPAAGLERFVLQPPPGERRLPLEVLHPVHAVWEVTARVPPVFLAGIGTSWMKPVRVEGVAAVLERNGRLDGEGLSLRWTYRTRADAVSPRDMDAWRVSVAAMRDLLSPVLVAPRAHAGASSAGDERAGASGVASSTGPDALLAVSGPNWSVLACGLLALLCGLLAAVRPARGVVAAALGASTARVRARPVVALGALLAVALPVAQLVSRRELFLWPAWIAASLPDASTYQPWRAPVLLLHLAGSLFLAVQGVAVAAALLRGRPGAERRLATLALGLSLLVWADALLLGWLGLGGNRIEAGMLTAFCGALSLFAHADSATSATSAVGDRDEVA